MSSATPHHHVVTDRASVVAWLDEHESRYVDELVELVRIDSVPPGEKSVLRRVERFFGDAPRVHWEPAHPGVADHPDGNRNPYVGRSDRQTLTVTWPATGPGRPLLLSAHADVVPAASDFNNAFRPVLRGRRLHGRGTADTKGNLLMAGAAVEAADALGIPRPAVQLDVVVEEEIGGNGALSGVLHGREAAGVVVLEPTGLEVFHGHRGVVEFTATIRGTAGHMGGAGTNAILGAVEFIGQLLALEARMVDLVRSDPAFRGYARPVQVNVGSIHGGNWHGSTAERCVVTASVGCAPSLGLAGARREIEQLAFRMPTPWRPEQVEVAYTGIHNAPYLGDPDSWLATALRDAVAITGAEPESRRAWCVSCDARLYGEHLRVPVVVFGAGQLDQAHTSTEFLDLDEWRRGVITLVELLGSSDRAQRTRGKGVVHGWHEG
jgi:acetylornithine deacetylase